MHDRRAAQRLHAHNSCWHSTERKIERERARDEHTKTNTDMNNAVAWTTNQLRTMALCFVWFNLMPPPLLYSLLHLRDINIFGCEWMLCIKLMLSTKLREKNDTVESRYILDWINEMLMFCYRISYSSQCTCKKRHCLSWLPCEIFLTQVAQINFFVFIYSLWSACERTCDQLLQWFELKNHLSPATAAFLELTSNPGID